MDSIAQAAVLPTGNLYSQEGYDLVGAAMEVYNQLGNGFLEAVYQEALEIELALRGIPFEAQPDIEIRYKERALRGRYRPDMVVSAGILVELKAMKALTANEQAQLMNYLKCANLRVGYLLNFGWESGLEWKRIVI